VISYVWASPLSPSPHTTQPEKSVFISENFTLVQS
jgi:hypothetical protein